MYIYINIAYTLVIRSQSMIAAKNKKMSPQAFALAKLTNFCRVSGELRRCSSCKENSAGAS